MRVNTTGPRDNTGQVAADTDLTLQPADHLSLPESVYRQLRAAILNGVLPPGEILRQEELARSLGVSRAPLREALPRLQAEGVVIQSPRRGYSVVSYDPGEIEEIFDLLMLVEHRAVALATERRSDSDVRKVLARVAAMEASDTAEQSQRVVWFDHNLAFHEALVAPAQRRHLLRFVSSLRGMVEPYIRAEIALTGEIPEANREHRLIAEAYADHDVALAAELAGAHVAQSGARLQAALVRRVRRDAAPTSATQTSGPPDRE